MLICIQLAVVAALFFRLQNSSGKALGVSTNIIDSKLIKKVARPAYRYFFEPLSGSKEEPDRKKLGLSEKAVYTVNADTLYDMKDYAPGPHPYTYRIAVLGDSFTSGLYVSTKDNWTEVLENTLSSSVICGLRRFEIINLAVPGYDPSYEAERFAIRGAKYQPDLVVLFLTDPYRNTEKILEFMAAYRKTHANPSEDEVSEAAFKEWGRLIGADEKYHHQLEALGKLRQYYSGKLIILLPSNSDNRQRFKYAYDFAVRDSLVRIHEVANTMMDPGFSCRDKYHPNERGHRLIAGDVYDYLMAKADFCSPVFR